MPPDIENEWITLCSRYGLDAVEVQIVSERYDMYKDYTSSGTGKALPLARWYKWYRIEKLSEGHAAIGDCSVDPEAISRKQVLGEADFLQILELYRNTERE
ncbi:uncharacterized protein METZ01_LOCUS159940 [marine metagenome]|uniref:Uncharacterized protein n=1 Tax=marine metagenome TaxID=408172 RepID=A0A382AZV3_9ZZZZ